ncbi:hypothetical protein PGUG_04872 [Meyerozyma guilliermondii ATCC 6260]|uniref:alpha-D-xyloside xylohydrolase n=1 Tax=Meyerozyma guilliermondii (strain ATCC 6260 / CBS 566 / DSM 6381 / JCM 1539 / NBRC 10279 / NRRL Y-324) TaxID=294746 RepID=A5DNM1_PICGU|nr:uncharacterized protein PGUG_04872 [Meyerozyma guilliermondii ATCC 6260]EDK40774.2 hypothetical protein PGUG_04872 [Meyerozyma guilliermondii ATCC 6260]
MEHVSIDRHIESDTRFSRGMWELKNGISANWAVEVVKSQVKDSEIHSVAATRKIWNRGATLNNPTITTKVSSPMEGVIGLEAYHHQSAYLRNGEPRYELNSLSPTSVDISDKEETVTLKAGSVLASVSKKDFGIDFVGDSKSLTKLGFRSLGFIEDSRYPDPKSSYGKARGYTVAQLHLSVGEKLYGLGERFGPFVKNGQRVEMWNEDGGTSSEWTYKNVPFYLSSRGYGVFVDNSSNVTFELQSERTTRVNIAAMGQGIRLYIIHGPDPKTILERYTNLTGKPALPPAWTFGLWLSTSFTTDYDIKTVSSFIQGMKDRDIPLSTFHFDCFWMKGFQWCDFEFDKDYFPDAKAMLSKLKKDFGIKVCVWINSYIGQESALFAEADSNGYFIKNVDGSSYQTDLWQAGMGIIDFTNPNAYKWFQAKLEKLVDLGVDSFKTDFGERIPCLDVKYHSGADPVAMHNYYTLLYNKCVFEVLEKKLGKHKACLFARSTSAGGQQYPVHWGGDCESTFEAMAETLRGGLSLTLCGYGFWSHDIGGFEGSPDPAVYKRWCAFGLLSSHSRLHGSGSYRVPWNFDDEASSVLSKFTKLKLSLMPHIYGAAVNAHNTGVPVMRAMLLEYPNDLCAQTADTQFMLGDNLLVAPVFNAEGNVNVYLPEGKWYGLLDGKTRDGGSGKWVAEVHDYHSLPILARSNSIFVSNDKATTPEYAWNEDFIVNMFDISEKGTLVQIPDPVKIGEFAASVEAKRIGQDIEVKATGKFKKGFQVKILGSAGKPVTVKNGKVVGTDAHGNTVVKVDNDKASIRY